MIFIPSMCISAVSDPFANITCDHNMANHPTSEFFSGPADNPDNLVAASYNNMINSQIL